MAESAEEEIMGRKKPKGAPRGRPFQPGAETSAIARAAARRRWGYCDSCNAVQPRARGHRWAAMRHEATCPIGIEQERARKLGALRVAWEHAGFGDSLTDEWLTQAVDRGQRPEDVPGIVAEHRARAAAKKAAAEEKRQADLARLLAEHKQAEAAVAADKHRADNPGCECEPCEAYRLEEFRRKAAS